MVLVGIIIRLFSRLIIKGSSTFPYLCNLYLLQIFFFFFGFITLYAWLCTLLSNADVIIFSLGKLFRGKLDFIKGYSPRPRKLYIWWNWQLAMEDSDFIIDHRWNGVVSKKNLSPLPPQRHVFYIYDFVRVVVLVCVFQLKVEKLDEIFCAH